MTASLFPHFDGVRPASSFATLEEQAKAAEAWETDPWVAREILRVELLSELVWDPCCGTGILSRAAREAGYTVYASDLYDWGFAEADTIGHDFLTHDRLWMPPGTEFSVFMNPPFSLATEFVDRAFELGARKVLCFQRQAWRESDERADWWAARPPARVWVCGSRATCWLFTIPPEERKSSQRDKPFAVYVWERGHRGAEIGGAIYKDGRVY